MLITPVIPHSWRSILQLILMGVEGIMPLALAKADKKILARRKVIINGLRKLIGKKKLITDEVGLKVFQSDALSTYSQKPLVVVFPETTKEVASILRFCNETGVKVVPRGSGTSITGSALPSEDAVVICLTKMDRVLNVNIDDRIVRVQAGVTTQAITEAVSDKGFFYGPDPESKLACTIAGNIATNAGGKHGLKYGVTTNNVLGVKLVTIEGDIIDLGGDFLDHIGYDLRSLIIGSEGQLGIVTEATVRVLPKPEASRPLLIGFASSTAAIECVGAVLSAGIIPSAIEYLDKNAVAICEEYAKAGYPKNAEAVLIIEVEGAEEEIDQIFMKINEIARQQEPIVVKISESKEESEEIWKGHQAITRAIGRISDYRSVDSSVPPGKLPEVLSSIAAICKNHKFRAANMFHAGDGNLKTLVLMDNNNPDDVERIEMVTSEILKVVIEAEGYISGEHGIGIEKRDVMSEQYSRQELAQQMRIKDVFDPDWLLNSGKVFPLELHR